MGSPLNHWYFWASDNWEAAAQPLHGMRWRNPLLTKNPVPWCVRWVTHSLAVSGFSLTRWLPSKSDHRASSCRHLISFAKPAESCRTLTSVYKQKGLLSCPRAQIALLPLYIYKIPLLTNSVASLFIFDKAFDFCQRSTGCRSKAKEGGGGQNSNLLSPNQTWRISCKVAINFWQKGASVRIFFCKYAMQVSL